MSVLGLSCGSKRLVFGVRAPCVRCASALCSVCERLVFGVRAPCVRCASVILLFHLLELGSAIAVPLSSRLVDLSFRYKIFVAEVDSGGECGPALCFFQVKLCKREPSVRRRQQQGRWRQEREEVRARSATHERRAEAVQAEELRGRCSLAGRHARHQVQAAIAETRPREGLSADGGGVSHQHLWKVARVGPSIAARSSALETLLVLAFIGATDLESTEATMGLLWSIINHRHSPEDQGTGINVPPGPVKVSALLAWSLLLSTVDSQKVSSRHLPSWLAGLICRGRRFTSWRS